MQRLESQDEQEEQAAEAEREAERRNRNSTASRTRLRENRYQRQQQAAEQLQYQREKAHEHAAEYGGAVPGGKDRMFEYLTTDTADAAGATLPDAGDNSALPGLKQLMLLALQEPSSALSTFILACQPMLYTDFYQLVRSTLLLLETGGNSSSDSNSNTGLSRGRSEEVRTLMLEWYVVVVFVFFVPVGLSTDSGCCWVVVSVVVGLVVVVQ